MTFHCYSVKRIVYIDLGIYVNIFSCTIYFTGLTPRSKSSTLSPGASKKVEKKKVRDKTSANEQKKKDETLDEAEAVKDVETENGTDKSEKTKEGDSTDSKVKSKTKSVSNQIKKTPKSVKRKRARIIEPVESSDDEGHLAVSPDRFR